MRRLPEVRLGGLQLALTADCGRVTGYSEVVPDRLAAMTLRRAQADGSCLTA